MSDRLVKWILQRARISTTPRPWRTHAAVLLTQNPDDMYADWSAWRQWVTDNQLDECEEWEDLDDQDAAIALYCEHWEQVRDLAEAGEPCHI